MIREEEIKAAVEASPLLGGCNLSVSGMNVKYCHKGQIVSDRQKNEEIIGLVMEGSMDVYSIALDGREILLSQLERGDCFGVVNLLTNTEFPTVLRCRTDTTLATMPKSQLLAVMEKKSELALRICRILQSENAVSDPEDRVPDHAVRKEEASAVPVGGTG